MRVDLHVLRRPGLQQLLRAVHGVRNDGHPVQHDRRLLRRLRLQRQPPVPERNVHPPRRRLFLDLIVLRRPSLQHLQPDM